MAKARDDARRNMRRSFALYDRDVDGDIVEVGSFSIRHAAGCWEGFSEDGEPTWGDYSETHEPGSHDELERILVVPRQRYAAQRRARGIPAVTA